MRRLALPAVIGALLFSFASSARADQDEALKRMGMRLQRLLDVVTDLRKEVVSLRTRVTELEVALKTARHQEEPKRRDYSGLVRLPRSTRMIPAYTAVTRDHLLDSQGKVAWVALPPKQVTEEMLTSEHLGQIIGRVLRRAKPPGYVFLKAEFYPVGTVPGPMAGVPTGKRGVWLKTSDAPGLRGLNQFDRFDLVMTVNVEMEDEPARAGGSEHQSGVDEPSSEPPEDTPEPTGSPARVKRKLAEVKAIVSDGRVVQPATVRNRIASPPTLLRGAAHPMMPVEEVMIAIDPAEVAALNLALAIGARLQVAIRSGQVSEGDGTEGVIPAIEPETVDESQLDEVQGPGISSVPGSQKRVRSEAVGVYVLDRRASIEATVAKAAVGADSPEEEAAIREVVEKTSANIEMTLELRLEGTFTTRIDSGDDEGRTADGTWSLVGENLILVTTHANGQERETPDDEVHGTWKDGRITMGKAGEDFVVVFVRQPR